MPSSTRRPGRSGTSTSVAAASSEPAPDTSSTDETPVTVIADETDPAAAVPPLADAAPAVAPAAIDDPPDSASSARTAADIAAARRAEANPTPPTAEAGGPPVAGAVPGTVIASATTRAQFAGDGTPGRPVGGVWRDRPLVLQIQPGAPLGQTSARSDYVIAECDASEHTVLPGMKTPVSKKIWSKGQLVFRPFYDAVLAEHARRVAEGTDADPVPAALPEGRADVPADVVTAEHGGTGGPAGDPAETSAPSPGEIDSGEVSMPSAGETSTPAVTP